jgi:DedD protein
MSAENGMPENEDVKKKALLRLAIAGVVTAAALGGLWWLDQSGNVAKKHPAAVAPAPIVAAPRPETPAPATEPLVTPEATAPTQETTTPTPPAPSDQATESTPPPPRVSNAPRTPMAVPAQPFAPRPLPKNTPTAAPAVAPPATLTPPAPATPSASSKGFVVQLGVFSNPDNARELVDKLNKQGIRAHMEARVQIGPFLNRQEADKAQSEMRKLGYNALVTQPYLAPPATR